MHSISLQPPTPSYGDRREPAPLTSSAIAQALDRSPDNGRTLVLSKLNLSDVSVDAAEELATIGREGTGRRVHHRKFPRCGSLSHPASQLDFIYSDPLAAYSQLTVLPSLDTLDISHNKIKRFPAHPGRLVDLRVFSFSKNKITRLPQYFSQFKNLEILKLDRNPLEWPPRNILQLDVPHEDEEAIKEWIAGILEWIDYNTSPMKANDDSGYAETPDWDPSLKHDKQKAWRFPLQDLDTESAASSHNRTFSVDSQTSSYHDDSALEMSSSRNGGQVPPKRSLYNPTVTAPDHSPIRPFEPYLSSPADSEKFDLPSSSSQNGLSDVGHTPPVHLRAASVTTEQRRPRSNSVSAKQSLPDLRAPQWSKLTDSPEQTFTDFMASRTEPLQRIAATKQHSVGGLDSKSDAPVSTAPERSTPSMAFERNSYFQRLSTMPTSIKLPAPLSSLVETARSILFVTSQIYQTIEHYANHAIDEKYSASFKRVLEPANSDMLQLIRALDRFDTTSQKSLPPPHICRAIAETCRNTVVVTNRAIGMFAIQLRMAPCDDHRYSRWILLELYASTAEISVAWANLLPHMDALKTFLLPKLSHHSRPSLTHDYQHYDPHHASVRLRNPDFVASRTHNARRHAGSFSYRDVELGKVLPAIDEPLSSSGGIAGQTPTLRIPKRQATAPPTAPSLGTSLSLPGPQPSPFSFGRTETPSAPRHSREHSFEQPLRSAPTGSKLKSLDLPTAVKQKPDREALLSIRQTVDSVFKGLGND
ncbi:hypothetical protein NMY22_g11944 [Coprinellus aureogranulatus]|nr:hypothetical protein NMY22_g11944 [Coprinellus aureogranulatus]